MKNGENLFSIPLALWFRKTVEKMESSNVDDSSSWKTFWIETYSELGGENSSGTKGCPRLAAFGLWYLGRIVINERPFKKWSIKKIDKELGKNVAYAVIALDLLEQGKGARHKGEFWGKIRYLYNQETGIEAAKSEQGAVRVATILFNEDLIRYPKEQNGSN